MGKHIKNTWKKICDKHQFKEFRFSGYYSSASLLHVIAKQKEKNTTKYILFCSGKTGSQHMCKNLKGHLVHLDRSLYQTQIRRMSREKYPPLSESQLSDGITIGVIRNPFEWLISFYCFNRPGRSFQQFISQWCRAGSSWFPDHWRQRKCLHYQVLNDQGEMFPDFVIRTEYMDAGLKILLEAVGESYHSHRTNVSWRWSDNPQAKKDIIRKFYSKDMIETVNKFYGEELAFYGYTINGPVDDRTLIIPDKSQMNKLTKLIKNK